MAKYHMKKLNTQELCSENFICIHHGYAPYADGH